MHQAHVHNPVSSLTIHRANSDHPVMPSSPSLYLCGLSSGEVAAVDHQGTVRILETAYSSIERSIDRVEIFFNVVCTVYF